MNPLDALAWVLDSEEGGPPMDAPYSERRGWCYALALRAFVERPAIFPQGDRVVVSLVHGFPRLQVPGRPIYGHAWVEIETESKLPAEFVTKGWPETYTTSTVYDPITNTTMPKPMYYRLGCIVEADNERWVDAKDVLDALLEYGTLGCWAPVEGLPEPPVWADE